MPEHQPLPEISVNADISVCIVEDDQDLREEVVQSLAEYGFDVRGFPGSRELYLGLLRRPCDVAILDVGLPGEDGFSIMEHLRATAVMGIIMLTARGQISDRVRALMGGADVYLVKPVDMAELVANVVSLGRRVRRIENQGQDTRDGWQISTDGWLLTSPSGTAVTLSSSERALLNILAQRPGTTIPRETLIKALGYHPDDVLSNRLDMLVSRLRRKISQTTGEKLPLHAVRGIGFSLPTSFMSASA